MLNEENFDYRKILKDAYSCRIERNPKYSLRAFARDMDIDPGQLSHIFKGTKNLSLQKALSISGKIGRTPLEKSLFYHCVELAHTPEGMQAEAIKKKISSTRAGLKDRSVNVSEDEFDTISDWYHFALLELAGVKDFNFDADSAADYLKISKVESVSGISRLLRLGFLEKIGRFYRKLRPITTTTEIPSIALKSFHQQMIGKASRALFEQSIDRRYISGITMKLPPEKLIEFKRLINEHEKQIHELARIYRDDPSAEVYQYNTQLFSLKAESYDQ
jgi:uncharacterized protein (TIGR02147 family)